MNPFSAALIAMRRSPYQTLAALLIVSLTFFVGYCFSLLLLGSEQVLKHFEAQPKVIGFFELNTPASTLEQVEKSLQQQPYVQSVAVVSQDQALEIYQQANSDQPLLLELVTASILQASIDVSGKNIADLAKIKQDLEQNSAIEDVIYQQDVTQTLQSWTQALRRTGIASMVLLGVTSLLTVLIIISMKVTTKKPAIHIMRMIGATRWYITWPFVWEGILYGLLGSVVGWTGMIMGLLYLTPWLTELLRGIPVLPVPPAVLAIQLSVGTIGGMLMGATIGTLAVRRIIKR